MLLRLVIATGLLASVSCASLDTVDKKPNRETISVLLVDALTCRQVAGGDPCDEGEQPKEVRLSDFDCVALPLRSARREDAHAQCVYAGEVIRVNGRREALPVSRGEFSLIDLTPGQYLPTRQWSLDKAE
ncbi:MAG: hypothetical protein AB7F91_03290 [Parvularculaceae bacterium]|nr:hypothetical protein [Parvularculaceae bacterium]